MTSVGEKDLPATITAGDKATAQSIVKLQSFVRGCMCRGKVERVVASLIQEMLRNGEVSKASITSMLETSNATLKTSDAEVNSESKFFTIADYNDRTDNTDDTDADLIDGIHYPRFLPDDVLDQSFNCSITLEKEDIMVKSNQSSSSLLKNQSSIRGRIDDRNIPDFHSREPSQEKRRSVASVSSTPGTITDQLGMNQGSSFNFESSIYSVPFLKSSPTPSSFDGSPALRMLHGLDTSIHSLGDDALLLSCESREKSLLSKGNHHQKLGSSVHTFLSPDKFLDRCSSVRDMISRGEEGWNNQNFDKVSLRDTEIEDSASSVGCGEGVSSTGSINSVNTESASDAKSSESISTKRKYTLQEKVAAFQKNQETPTISSYKKGASIFGSKRPQRSKSAPSRSSGHLAAFVLPSSENSNSINSEEFIATRDILEDVVGDSSNFFRPLSIAERIEQFRSANRVHDTRIADCESSEKVIFSNDAEIKRVDYATRLYIMDNSASKIQALTRGYLYRKKDKEATVAVVKWLKQHKMLDEDAPASTLLLSEEMREEAVQVLEAEIEQYDPSESNHNESDPSEHSGDQNGRSTSQTTMSLTQRKQAYEQMTKAIKSVGDIQKNSSKLVSAEMSAPLSERKRAFETCLPRNDATFEEQDREYFELKKEKAQKAMATLNKKQHESAVKIQALARGFIERKFDVRSMMGVVQWVKEQQDTFLPYYDPENDEPDTDVLESAWTFLESNNTWTKDKEVLSKEKTVSDDASINILQDDPHPTQINVQELLNTWEWLLSNEANKRKNRRFAEEKEDREPTNANLQDLQDWIENNRVLVNIDGELEFSDKGKRKRSKPNCVRVVRTKDGVWTVDLDKNQSDSGERSQTTEESEKHVARKANHARSDKISAFSDKIEGENTVERNDGIVTSAIEGGESMIVCRRDELDLTTTHDSECYEGKIVASGVHCRFPGSQRTSILELESTEVRKTKDLVDLWKFLVSHGMDMRALRRYEERAGETIDQKREKGRTIDLLTTNSNAACTPNRVRGETQRRDDCADHKNSGAVVLSFGQHSHTIPTVSSRKKAFESHLAKNGRGTEKSIHLARSPSDISIQVPKYSRHKMHDEMYINKGDGVVYINDDVPASSANLSKFSNTNASRENYRQHKMHDEMYGSEGDGVEYIAEDLSGSYADLNYLQKSCSNENGCHAGYGRHKMHDELSDNNGDGVQYIDEDLSASYASLTVLSQGEEDIPSLKDMMNYWAVSNYHYNALQKQRLDGSSSDEPLDGQELVLEKTKWRESAADNDFLCALAWLRSKGIELSTLDKRSTDEEFSKGDSIASDAKKDNMVNSLNWLQSSGYCETRSSEGCSTDDAQSKDRKSNYKDTSSSSSSNDDETWNDDLPIAVLEAVIPQKIEMADTLKWLISQGYRTPSRKSSNGDSREIEKLGEESTFDFDKALVDSDVESIVRISPPSSSEISNALDWLESREKEAQQAGGSNENSGKAAEKNVDFENVLHSLSWLKKNGFKLGKPSGAQNPEELYDSTPSRKEVQQALETLVKDSDPSVDESIATEEETPSDIKSRSKFDDNMERALAWLKQRGMKVPRKLKSNSKNQSRTSGSTRSQPSKVIPVFSKQANYTAFGFPTCRDLETSDRGLPQHIKQFQRDPSRKMKARVSKVPNERKNATKFNARSDGVSPALQWLQFKKGIPIDNKSTTTKPEILSSSGTIQKENTFSNGNSKTNNSRRHSKKVFPDEISVEEMEAVLKLSETQSSAPTSSDMKQALSWLKLRESRRQAQAAASSFVPQRSQEVDAQVGQSNSEVRLHQPKVPGDNEQVAQLEKGHHTDEQRQVNEALEDDKMEKSSGQRSSEKTQKTKRCGKKSRIRSCDKKQENINSNLRQSRGDMTKALMFLQQRRGTATKTKATSQNIDFDGDIETFKPIAPSYSSPKKSSADKANTLREAAELVKFESTEKSEMKGLSSADTVGESKALPRSQEEIDFVNALNFLTGSTSKAQADEPYFAKLDSMLPRKSSESNEARAKDMAKALKWIKKQGVTMSGSIQSKVSKATSPEDSPIISGSDVKTMEAYKESGDTKASEPFVSTSLSPRKSSVNATDRNIAVSEDYQNCIRWLSEEDRDSIKDAKHFKKLDIMLPKTAKQSIEERARDMVKALQWVKKSSAKKDAATSNTTKDMSDLDDKTSNIKKKSQSPGRRASTSPTSRAKPKLTVRKRKSKQSSAPGPSLPDLSEDNNTKNALQWIKNQERESLVDAAAFKKLNSMLPKRAGQTPEERATEMSKALKLTKKNYDDRTLKPPTDEAMMSLEEEEQQAYRFLLAKKEGKDYMSMEDAAVLKKVDNMMPTKTNQSSEERAKQMVKMIGWLKKKGKI
ncbi:IQ calmodulin-binding motif-containing protein [Nitzschia inconspicua]|uniref:IQ calmodulin-binding motif-containing protein n=1 Tax=Nitzschia inconspicua TaxID=303405 RepID=A0A9K3KGY9_9STRA|nr:IQ calmodulin-binding motif-containing protein [Nitzschia inconspicua]